MWIEKVVRRGMKVIFKWVIIIIVAFLAIGFLIGWLIF